MSSTQILDKEKSLILNKSNLDKTNNNQINTKTIPIQDKENTNITNKEIINNNNNNEQIVEKKIVYSLTESDINKQKINFPQGEPTQFNLNLNGEIKSDKSKQEKTVVCWNCQSL